jgi:BlaI family penicillinase repressor
MKRLPRISDAEWRVMQVLWSASSGLTADEVVEALQGKVAWNARTIRTLINRLLQKKALKHEKEGRKYRYFPAVRQEQCVRQERRSFIQRVYGGTVAPMLAAFIDDAQLSPADIEELKRMLDRKGRPQ